MESGQFRPKTVAPKTTRPTINSIQISPDICNLQKKGIISIDFIR